VLARLKKPWSDRRAERTLGAASLLVCLGVALMIAFVAARAWPTFTHNGISWLGPGGNLTTQVEAMLATSTKPPASAFHVRVWPILYGTLLVTALALVLAVPLAVLSAVFIVELAPASVRRVLVPVVRLLASVPSQAFPAEVNAPVSAGVAAGRVAATDVTRGLPIIEQGAA